MLGIAMERGLLRCIQTNPSLRAESKLDILLIECPNTIAVGLWCFHLNAFLVSASTQ